MVALTAAHFTFRARIILLFFVVGYFCIFTLLSFERFGDSIRLASDAEDVHGRQGDEFHWTNSSKKISAKSKRDKFPAANDEEQRSTEQQSAKQQQLKQETDEKEQLEELEQQLKETAKEQQLKQKPAEEKQLEETTEKEQLKEKAKEQQQRQKASEKEQLKQETAEEQQLEHSRNGGENESASTDGADDTMTYVYDGRRLPYAFRSSRHNDTTLFVADVLSSDASFSLKDRLTLRNRVNKTSLLLMWDTTAFSDVNLRACPDWNCAVTTDRSRIGDANAVLFSTTPFRVQQRLQQYFVYFSQESPVHSDHFASDNNFPGRERVPHFNMTLGFRHDSPAASPYGFTVRLAKRSRLSWASVLAEIAPALVTKTKPIAWFVSHCMTDSGREKIAEALQNEIQIDIYGVCGQLQCSRGDTKCQDILNFDYFFYFAAENSLCTDYATEKLWSSGFGRQIVPIVLRRRLAAAVAPPHSFIAVDDFADAAQMAAFLRELMANRTKYLEYFKWRMNYETVLLDARSDPMAERPWGFCQLCRLTQTRPWPRAHIADMAAFWDASCETGGNFARQFVENSEIARREKHENDAKMNGTQVGVTKSNEANGRIGNAELARKVESVWKLRKNEE